MKKEIVFEIGGEGGSIAIYREERKDKTVYIYDHNETDFSESGLDIAYTNEFNSFEEAFDKLDRQYPWHVLYLDKIDAPYKRLVIDKLIIKLNSPDNVFKNEFYSQVQFERQLNTSFQLEKKQVFTGLYEIDATPIVELNSNNKNIPLKGFNIEGQIEVLYNSILIKDKEGKIEFILPSDKFFIETRAITELKMMWVEG
jgi:hypothetical protein